jgi:hypothetical protein
MEDAVVGAAETVSFQDLIRIGGEVPIGEEQEFDQGEVYAVLS